jgi:hypothetical protein
MNSPSENSSIAHARPVFVIGTGRSGTHWLGYSLVNHPEVYATIEKSPMFNLSTKMALNPGLEDALFGKLASAYEIELKNASGRIYLDKSHPNIWLAERLQKFFPGSLFLGIERNPYATVASMIKHKGVASWHSRWKNFPVPNRFLGISPEIAETYDTLPLSSQCALRWLAHHNRMKHLANTLTNNLFLIYYEEFMKDTENTINKLKHFLHLEKSIKYPNIRSESLNKWKTQLSHEQINQIQDIVGFPPE